MDKKIITLVSIGTVFVIIVIAFFINRCQPLIRGVDDYAEEKCYEECSKQGKIASGGGYSEGGSLCYPRIVCKCVDKHDYIWYSCVNGTCRAKQV